MRLYRDALGAEAVVSDTPEPVLLGAAMVAAVAGGIHGDLFQALDGMAPCQDAIVADPTWVRTHEAAYHVYRKLFAVSK